MRIVGPSEDAVRAAPPNPPKSLAHSLNNVAAWLGDTSIEK